METKTSQAVCYLCALILIPPFVLSVWVSRLLSGTGSELSCEVSVSNQNDAVKISNGYTYKSQLTPVITEVSPRRGGTAGGTLLTITGSGFRCSGATNLSRKTYDAAQRRAHIMDHWSRIKRSSFVNNSFQFMGHLRFHLGLMHHSKNSSVYLF